MQILICHADRRKVRVLSDMIGAKNSAIKVITVDCLSRAYHFVEHQEPDCVIVDGDIAQSDDFGQFSALAKILKIGCLVVCKSAAISEKCRPIGLSTYVFRPPNSEFIPALEQALLHTPSRRIGSDRKPNAQVYNRQHILMIGASTGGVDALARVLRHFDTTSPPTLIVQHTGDNFTSSLVRLLDRATQANVRPARHGDTLKSGCVYLSPSNDVHVGLGANNLRKVALTKGDPISGHRPSIDALFQSGRPIARRVTAALLTGMGRDGAAGLFALHQAGSHTIAQDQATSVVYGMPRIAMEMGAVSQQVPLTEIGPALLQSAQMKQ